MSEVKHTPGPWYFDGPSTNIIVWSGPGKRVCFTTSDGPVRENARLIAAAPELLAALKALSASVFLPNEQTSPELKVALEMTVSAISKAEGRA